MDQVTFSTQTWLDAMKTAAQEVVKTTFNLAGFEGATRQDNLPWNNTIGAYVPLVGKQYSLQLGLVSTAEGCQRIARRLLNLKEHDILLEEEMADAIREIVNILGGLSKKIIEGDIPASSLGLPIFINGHITITKEQTAGSEMIKIGDVICYLIVLRQK